MKELLEKYYRGFAQKKGWEEGLSDDFEFSDLAHNEPVVGKQAYMTIIARFSKIYKTMRVKKMIIHGEDACVIATYDFKFPNRKEVSSDIAEVWTAKNGQLQSLCIYFDTLLFDSNSKPA